ncbi:MAG: hypothetical protein LBO02_03760 [Holosporaceae bacterium]|jgi:hypothetical protein|nr:hypothetical protein [Holosporaceae bacterium]
MIKHILFAFLLLCGDAFSMYYAPSPLWREERLQEFIGRFWDMSEDIRKAVRKNDLGNAKKCYEDFHAFLDDSLPLVRKFPQFGGFVYDQFVYLLGDLAEFCKEARGEDGLFFYNKEHDYIFETIVPDRAKFLEKKRARRARLAAAQNQNERNIVQRSALPRLSQTPMPRARPR